MFQLGAYQLEENSEKNVGFAGGLVLLITLGGPLGTPTVAPTFDLVDVRNASLQYP